MAEGGRRLLRSEPGLAEERRRVPPPPARHARGALVQVPPGRAVGRGPGLPPSQRGNPARRVTRVGAEKDNEPTSTQSLELGSPT